MNLWYQKIYLGSQLFFVMLWLVYNSISKQSVHISPWLLVLFISGCTTFVLIWLLMSRIVFSSSSLPFVLFICFFTFRSLIDLDPHQASELLIGTTGGILLFYILGAYVSICIASLTKLDDKNCTRWVGFIYLSISIFIFITYAMFVYLLGSEAEVLDLFINADGSYQRKGTLLTLLYIIYSSLFLLLRACSLPWKGIYITLFIFNTLLFIFYSQLVRSNSGFVTILLISLAVIYLKLMSIKRKIIPFSFLFYIFILLIFMAIYFDFYSIYGIDFYSIYGIDFYLSHLRIFGYGDFEFSSVSSRVDFLSYIPSQIEHGIFFGDLNSDTKAGVPGSYPHSLIFHSLTHIGLAGFVLVLIIVFSLLIRNGLFSVRRAINLYNSSGWITKLHFVHTLPVVIVAVFFQSMTWAPFWFVLGLYIPIFKLRRGVNE
jgi:hypothetical protein